MYEDHLDGQSKGSRENGMAGDGDQGVTAPSSASRMLPEEPQSPAGSTHLNHGSSMNPGTQSRNSHGGPDKPSSMENWRQAVSELSDVV
jgi:hypothetical protein